MVKQFKVLKFNEYLLFKVGIFRNQFPQKSISNGFFKSPLIYYLLFVSITFIISSTLFAYQNVAEFSSALRACLLTISVVQASGMFISFGFHTAKVQAVHHELQEFVDKSNKGK